MKKIKQYGYSGDGDLTPMKNGGWVQFGEHRQHMKVAESEVARLRRVVGRALVFLEDNNIGSVFTLLRDAALKQLDEESDHG